MALSRNHLKPLLVSLTVAVCVSGCESEPEAPPTTATVIGSASVDGKPITGGKISIYSVTDRRRRVSGRIMFDGSFKVVGAPLGEVKMTISTAIIKRGDPDNYMPIPRKYMNPAKTDFTFDLKPGDNTDILLDCKTS